MVWSHEFGKKWVEDSHFHSLNFDAPRIRGVVQAALHDVTDGLTLAEDLSQVLGAQHVSQRCRSQKTG